MKIERLAGLPGKPTLISDPDGFSFVVQGALGYVNGPRTTTFSSAIRAWNAMVRRIRKANAGEKP